MGPHCIHDLNHLEWGRGGGGGGGGDQIVPFVFSIETYALYVMYKEDIVLAKLFSSSSVPYSLGVP